MAYVRTHMCIKCGKSYYNDEVEHNDICECGDKIKRVEISSGKYLNELGEKSKEAYNEDCENYIEKKDRYDLVNPYCKDKKKFLFGKVNCYNCKN